ncbi:MAG: bifunctional DNA primase/helicase [Gammaproteobacteria bacterium]|nr:MAG: bifunctional DNA primase/helicase [Gammaproteobacteria bacterium]
MTNNMNDALRNQVKQRLVHDYGFKTRGEWFQQGKCPNCAKRELFAFADSPWVVKCNRLNKCDYSEHIKSLYPDLFEDWSKNHPQTKENPNAAAEAYLRDARGFTLGRLVGLYTQESYFDAEKKIGSATVRFTIGPGSQWERIIDRPERFGGQKGRALGSYKGKWWAGNQDLSKATEIWVTEGIFDAIALQHAGLVAVSNISAKHFPNEAITELLNARSKAKQRPPKIIWAMDSDIAGRSATKKHIAECEKRSIPTAAAQPIHGDWNEMWQMGLLNDSGIEDALHRGSLLTAKSAADKGNLIWSRDGYNQFHFAFDNRLYWFDMDFGKYNKTYEMLSDAAERDGESVDVDEIKKRALIESSAVVEIATCYPKALYFLRNDVTDESFYYFSITHPNGRSIQARFSASATSTAGDFKKRLISVSAGAIFTGTSSQLDSIMKAQLRNIKTVETIDFVGYDKTRGIYVFNDFAMANGKLYEINQEDYFEIGKQHTVKPLSSIEMDINKDKLEYNDKWLPHVFNAFGTQGIVALIYWIGTLFAEQIRAYNKSYPFLEVVGEAGSGKTTLLEFLWKLYGRDNHEGMNPNTATLAMRSRSFNKVSNLPVVLIESDKEDVKTAKVRQFDFDELKTAYNGRPFRGRGVKNSGNDTYEPPFRGAIVISQNNPVDASEAILQRICHLYFTRDKHNAESKASAEYLERLSTDELSYFLIKILSQEKQILDKYRESYARYDKYLSEQPEIKISRIAKNHAQLLAMLNAVKGLIGLTKEQAVAVQEALIDMAKNRQTAMNRDHPMVDEFFETLEYLKDKAGSNRELMLDHCGKNGLMGINMKEYEVRCGYFGIRIPPMTELKSALKGSKRYPFLGIKSVNSCLNSKTKKCWCFDVSKD